MKKKKQGHRWFRRKRVLLPTLGLAGSLGMYGWTDQVPPPPGSYFEGQPHITENVQFITDSSWLNAQGQRELEQSIFDSVIEMIQGASNFILLDMFLFNDYQGPVPETTRGISAELTQALLQQKSLYPDIEIVVISDPINTVYGGAVSKHFEALESANIKVVLTDLTRLRDSNPVYSFIWRWLIRPFGNTQGGTLPNPFGAGRVTLRSYLRMVNFKANHRKVLITDSPAEGLRALVTSANPHDGSSAHRNVALLFDGDAVIDLLGAENAVLKLSGAEPVVPPESRKDADQIESIADASTVQVVTEQRIKEAALEQLEVMPAGSRVDLLMFYLSDRDVVEALVHAHKRGVNVRVILDVNRDAFGREKNGVPNRPVAHELHKAGIPVRWCDTQGEQCHAKTLFTQTAGETTLLLGSANYTRRNLDNFNLESNVLLKGSSRTPALTAAAAYFDTQWNNSDGRSYTVDYSVHRDESLVRRWLYRSMEATGLSTF
ncbi:MAG: phospholipase [Granulosicoccus sp.]|nr:phospholipase [Granulosicoccus sp.]